MLHRRPYRETSAIVDLFTQDFGKISCVAKGVQRPKNGWRGLLQPFTPLLVSFSGKGELKNALQVEATSIPFNLVGKRSYCGFYINEMLVRGLVKEESVSLLYGKYQATLQCLLDGEIEATLREFERCLLDELGYGIDFYHVAESNSDIEVTGEYHFEPELGFVAKGEIESDQFTPRKRIYSGQIIQDINHAVWHEHSLIAAKYIFRAALKLIIGDKPLKSKELFRSLKG